MAVEKRHKKAPLDTKYVLKTYWGFLKKYKALAMLCLIFIFFVTFASYSMRYLFKVVIDKGASFAAKEISATQFVSAIGIIGAIWIGAIIFSAKSLRSVFACYRYISE